MYLKLLKNDLKNNILQTMAIAFFIILSSSFLSCAAQLGVQLSNSINELFEKAKTPHILQMHSGDIDLEIMEKFVAKNKEIKEYQILDFLNIDNSAMSFNDNSLKDLVYDNGFSTQSEKFDFLLDINNEKINAKKGEVYVPVFYFISGLVKSGDTLKIKDYELKVAGFVRDSQMNSSISSSKRFVINKLDYDNIKSFGLVEHLIEFYLSDVEMTSKVQSAYNSENLESSGPPIITFSLFKMVNALSDGISIAALAFISLLVILISLFCIRLSLLAKLEEDYKELSILKAIGIAHKDIKKVFLYKYVFIGALSCLIGFALSFLIKAPFLNNIKMFFGSAKADMMTYVLGFTACFIVFAIVYFSMSKISKRLRHLSINRPFEDEKQSNLSISYLPRRLFLAISDVFSKKKIYFTMVCVTILSVFILILPMSVYTTISDKSFINYMGIGSYDVRIDISEIADNKDKMNILLGKIKNDDSIEKYDIIKSKLIDYKTSKGNIEKIWIDFSTQTTFPIKYVYGSMPLKDDEISLSKIKADDLSKKVGDEMTLMIGNKEKKVKVSGIFSDLTNGGKTARASFKTDDKDMIWMIIPVKLKDKVVTEDFIKKYQDDFSFAKFSDTKLYINQIFGNTIATVYNITCLGFFASLFLIFTITVLFIRMLYLKDSGENALLKSIGFTNKDIYIQYFIKSALILSFGLILGNVFSLTIGDKLASGILNVIGIANVQFLKDTLFSYVSVPISMIIITTLATYLGARGLNKMNISQILKEDV